LRADRVEETLTVLQEFKRDIEKFGVRKVVAVATEALRRAKNSEDFLRLVKEKVGIEVKVITPEEEGKLSFLAVAFSLKPAGKFLVVDQGGGSTEFVFGKGMEMDKLISLPLGIVNLTENFLKHDPPLPEEIERLMDFLEEKMRPLKERVDEVVGLGGTITTLCALEKGIYPYKPKEIHGSELSIDALKKWFSRLSVIPSSERSKRYKQIEDKRAEVILSDIAMFIKVLEIFEKDSLRVSDWGVKQGLLLRELYNI
jgi:exopolyphosphatase/guanosine-5'-triphosphate,3'-diphosphate pyrophosphatase